MICSRNRFQQLPRVKGAFTLIEIMMAVAIMGLILMVGVPSFTKTARKEGMRKALSDVTEACRGARTRAILDGKPATLTISGHSISGGSVSEMIPESVTILSVGVNFVEYVDSGQATVTFYPTGITDEFEITMQGPDGEIRQVSLDIVSGTPLVESLSK